MSPEYNLYKKFIRDLEFNAACPQETGQRALQNANQINVDTDVVTEYVRQHVLHLAIMIANSIDHILVVQEELHKQHG